MRIFAKAFLDDRETREVTSEKTLCLNSEKTLKM